MCVLFFLLPPQSVNKDTLVCSFSLHHLSFEAPRRRVDLPVLGSSRPRVRSEPLSRWSVFSFFSSLFNQLIKIPWYVQKNYLRSDVTKCHVLGLSCGERDTLLVSSKTNLHMHHHTLPTPPIRSCFVSTTKCRFNASLAQTPNNSISTLPSRTSPYPILL